MGFIDGGISAVRMVCGDEIFGWTLVHSLELIFIVGVNYSPILV